MGIYLKPINEKPDYVDPRKIVQDHVPDQKLEILASREVMVQRWIMREHILQDNHTNVYVVYDAKLSDRETYSHAHRLKPSEIKEGGGVDPKPGWGLKLTDDTLEKSRWEALKSFARTQESISRGRRNEVKSNQE